MDMEARAIFGLFVWRGIIIYDVTIHPSRGSRINPKLKVCEHNWAAHASPVSFVTDIIDISVCPGFLNKHEKCKSAFSRSAVSKHQLRDTVAKRTKHS